MTKKMNIDMNSVVERVMRLPRVVDCDFFAEITLAYTSLLFQKNPRWMLFRCYVNGCCCRCCVSVC